MNIKVTTFTVSEESIYTFAYSLKLGGLLFISFSIISQWVLPGSDLINAIRIGNMISQTAVFKSGCSSSKFLSNKSISHKTKSNILPFKRYIHLSRAIACADPKSFVRLG